jgi:hypothetical protein
MHRDADHSLLQHVEDLAKQNKKWEVLKKDLLEARQHRVGLEKLLRESRSWRRTKSLSPSPLPERQRIEEEVLAARQNTELQQQRARVLGESLTAAQQKLQRPVSTPEVTPDHFWTPPDPPT